jgi:signal transduction histidine kinase/ActR/RegA family two-component response regulator
MTPLSVAALVLAGICLYMAATVFFLRGLGPEQRNYLPFALLCLLLTGYASLAGVLYTNLDPLVARPIQLAQVGLALASLPVMMHFISRITHNRNRAIQYATIGLWLVVASYAALIPTELLFGYEIEPKELVFFGVPHTVVEVAAGPAMPFFMLAVVFSFCGYLWMLIHGVRQRTSGAIPFLVGVVLLMAATVNDILVLEGVYSGFYLMEAGFLLIAIAGSVALTMDARKRERELADVHEELQELRGVEEQLAQSERLAVLGRMLSGVAHELNNPLTSVAGIAEGLDPERVDPEVRPRIAMMRREAMRAGNVVRGLLEFARQEGGDFGPVSLDDVVDQVVALRRDEQRTAGIETIIRRDVAAPVVEADPDQLVQLLLNLVLNAEQALNGRTDGVEGGRVVIRTRERGDQLILFVEDDGPGIPPDALPRIFDPFFTTRQRSRGTGLGLFLAATVAERHGGILSARNVKAGGARFTLRLPLTQVQPEAGEDSIPIDVAAILAGRGDPFSPRSTALDSGHFLGYGAERSRSLLAGARVLVVDDEEGVLLSVQSALESAGAEVAAVQDSATAMERLDEHGWDVVLCDVIMPDLDGLELLEWVHQRSPGLSQRFVFMTGDIFATQAREISEQRSLHVLQKPFRARELMEVVREVVDAHREEETGDRLSGGGLPDAAGGGRQGSGR